MSDHPTRRRAFTIIGMSAATLAAAGRSALADVTDYEWRGTAMGAPARMVFCGGDAPAIRAIAETAVAEIDRLENALSLFRDTSEVSRLNRDGVLTTPSADFRNALALGRAVAEASAGLFDPTVQALWEAHADWFAANPGAPLPPDDVIAEARARVDWRRMAIGADRIILGAGQRITLNGLGQGYVTDRVADLLRAHGFVHVLVDLGEQRALGPRPDGSPWRVAQPDADPIPLRDSALATSEGAGCVLGAGGQAHHLFDPRSGRSAAQWRRITVAHRRAAVADALSTALYGASGDEIKMILPRFPGARLAAAVL